MIGSTRASGRVVRRPRGTHTHRDHNNRVELYWQDREETNFYFSAQVHASPGRPRHFALIVPLAISLHARVSRLGQRTPSRVPRTWRVACVHSAHWQGTAHTARADSPHGRATALQCRVRSTRGFPARFSPACPFPVHTTVAHLIAHTTSAWHRRCRLLAAATVVMLSLTLACSITSSSQRGGHLSHLRGRRCILQVVLERVEECSHPLLCCVEHLSTHTHSAIVSPRERGEQGQMHPVRREHACGEASHT